MGDPAFRRTNCLPKPPRVALARAGVASIFLLAAPAAAQQPATAADRPQLLQQAQDARAGGDHARALELAARAGAIQMTPSVRLFIAEEQDALGHAAEAYESAELCVDSAERDAQLRNRDAILERCRALLAALRPQVAEVRVHVSDTAATDVRLLLPRAATAAESAAGRGPGVEAAQDTTGAASAPSAPSAAPATPLPVAAAPAGTVPEAARNVVVVRASAPGRLPLRQDLAVGSGESVVLDVVLPPDPGAASAVEARDGSARAAAAPAQRGVPAGAVLTASGAAVALGAAAAFFVLRSQAIGNCAAGDDGSLVCPTQRDADRAQYATTWTVLADVSVAAGAALVAGGALWLLAGRREGERPRFNVAAAPVQGGAVLGVGGSL